MVLAVLHILLKDANKLHISRALFKFSHKTGPWHSKDFLKTSKFGIGSKTLHDERLVSKIIRSL